MNAEEDGKDQENDAEDREKAEVDGSEDVGGEETGILESDVPADEEGRLDVLLQVLQIGEVLVAATGHHCPHQHAYNYHSHPNASNADQLIH